MRRGGVAGAAWGGAPPAPACRGRACRGVPSPATTRTWHCAAGSFMSASVPEQRRSGGERQARGSAFWRQEARDRTSLTARRAHGRWRGGQRRRWGRRRSAAGARQAAPSHGAQVPPVGALVSLTLGAGRVGDEPRQAVVAAEVRASLGGRPVWAPFDMARCGDPRKRRGDPVGTCAASCGENTARDPRTRSFLRGPTDAIFFTGTQGRDLFLRGPQEEARGPQETIPPVARRRISHSFSTSRTSYVYRLLSLVVYIHRCDPLKPGRPYRVRSQVRQANTRALHAFVLPLCLFECHSPRLKS